jgi:hypothetical protein
MEPLDPLDNARKRHGNHWLDLVVGASAIAIAVASLLIALRQSQIMERQLAASVWPYLQYGTSNTSDEGAKAIRFEIENVGVGPARIHSMSLRYKDKPVRSTAGLIEACCADLLAEGKPSRFTSTLHDQVLAPNKPKNFILFNDVPANVRYWDRLNLERHNVQIKVCYCSVLDDCWMLDSHQTAAQPLAVCPAPQDDDYQD